MRIRVLGSSGGIGKGRKTTSFLLDDDILFDAGSGVGELTLAEMQKIRTVFLTHSHLDHISHLSFLLDTLFNHLQSPIQVFAQQDTINTIKEHIFNWAVWPDFSVLPDAQNPVVIFHAMEAGEEKILGKRSIKMIAVNHTVPTVALSATQNGKSFAFSADTTSNETLWQGLNKLESLDLLFVEAAFPNEQIELCKIAKHYCPSLLAEDLKKLKHQPKICISHTMPVDEELVMQQCHEAIPDRELSLLATGQVYEL
ncbi:MAG: 3',5'-cyclic-nucleotide phosphodiesterase [Gammaproteobacteria bacterium]|nr:3',5'-cyclic-nucleotide phosphodiesterase [Gammaproteobacteria bacterium]